MKVVESKKYLGKTLLKKGYITSKQLKVAKILSETKDQDFLDILISNLFVSAQDLGQVLAEINELEFVDLRDICPSDKAVNAIRYSIAKDANILPFDLIDDILYIAIGNPQDTRAIDLILEHSKYNVKVYVANIKLISRYIELSYNKNVSYDRDIKELIDKIASTGKYYEIGELVDKIISSAIIERASDIHISPEGKNMNIAFRIDGIVELKYIIPKSLHSYILSRIKIISNIDVADKVHASEGSASFEFLSEKFDLRVSIIPTLNGDLVVMRVLSKFVAQFDLETLGFPKQHLDRLKKMINYTQGLVIVTGPTGSGKSTTLYSVLKGANVLERNTLTIEDPIEYEIPFVKQTEVNEKLGYTFNAALKYFVRQDPDIILIGELRDEETANLAIQASLTGHLVLSTLHANDSITTIPRLLKLGVDSLLVAQAVRGIVAQRLIRKLCTCKIEKKVNKDYFKEFISDSEIERLGIEDNVTVYEENGCQACQDTGYLGRVGVVELLEINDKVSEMILNNERTFLISQYAIENDLYYTLKEDGINKILSGVSSLKEAKRILS